MSDTPAWEDTQPTAPTGDTPKWEDTAPNVDSGLSTIRNAISNAGKDIFQKPAQVLVNLATNPITQAQTLPYLGGVAGVVGGAFVGQPAAGGATGAMAGQTLKDLALTAYNDPSAPKTTAQGLENLGEAGLTGAAAGSAVSTGDALLGFAKAGKGMGAVEKAAGIIDSTPELRPTPANLGQTLKTLENQVNGGTITDPQTAKDSLNLLKDIRDNPKLYGLSKVAKVQIDRLWPQVQDLVSSLVDEANADKIAAGTLPSRFGLVQDAAKYYRVLAPAKVVGTVLNTLAGNPIKAAGTSATVGSIIWTLKQLGLK